MRHALTNCRILCESALRDGSALLIDGSRISEIVAATSIPDGYDEIDLEGAILSPGFIDLQVNGGNGVLFNDAPTVESLRSIALAHHQFGTTAFLPTLISDDLEVIRRGIDAVATAIAAGVPGILGIHIEGPFLNVEKRGIHPEDKIRKSDLAGLDYLQPIAGGKTLVTLAPECVPPEHIRILRNRGFSVCAGHSNASFEELSSAFDEGIEGVTHLFNAMSPLVNRAPGAVGAALDNPECWCCIIVDGRHVHPASLRVALKAKGGHQRFILVTDAMPTVGQGEKRFILNEEEVNVVDGVCQNEDGTLAGSDLNMAQAVSNTIALLGQEFSAAIEMASINPARFLGVDDEMGDIVPGKRANLVALNESGNAVSTWIDGQRVWKASK
jgi:N-acetylglucosamine-6-phosphate deacetylase